jgi:hypothetical protein
MPHQPKHLAHATPSELVRFSRCQSRESAAAGLPGPRPDAAACPALPCARSKESISGGYLEYLQQQEQQQLEEAWSELSSKYKQQQQQQR